MASTTSPSLEAEILARGLASARDWARLTEAARALFAEGQLWARSRGLILVDTKYEFGKVGDALYVIDEIHTPDSSRYWVADEYEARFAKGEDQRMLDKENIRQWLIREAGFSGPRHPAADSRPGARGLGGEVPGGLRAHHGHGADTRGGRRTRAHREKPARGGPSVRALCPKVQMTRGLRPSLQCGQTH